MGSRTVLRAVSVFVAIVSLPACGGCGEDAPERGLIEPGEIIGRVETSAEIPSGNCLVLVENAPLGGRCDGSGQFDIRGLPPGRWDLRVTADAGPLALPARRVVAASNSGFITDLGVVRIAQAGQIGGRVIGSADAGSVIIVPAFGVATAPNPNGGYLLDGVPPGVHDVYLVEPDGTVVHADVTVLSGKTTVGVNLDVGAVQAVSSEIHGLALRGDGTPGDNGGLIVELVDERDGDVVATDTTDDDGTFTLPAGAGVYLVRAREEGNPITAIAPSVVPTGAVPVVLSSPLVVFPSGGDLDGDGSPDAADPDIDGDGVSNDGDAFDYDPGETEDVDQDGVGDRIDLATTGGVVDTHTDTPDTDGDGRLDFEDNCDAIVNVSQSDVDGDGAGDACDNCPTTPNEDQADSVGNGIGDACRLCESNADCPSEQLCGEEGRCVGCLTTAQCGDRVCVDNACVACTTTAQCGGGEVCNVPLGVCQDCITSFDCATDEACVSGTCYAECTSDAQCAGGYCIDNACVMCRDNADCPQSDWCDAGLCRAQCTTDAACTLGRDCDLATGTCVISCSSQCPASFECDGEGVCRQFCDATFPCPGNLVCDTGSRRCVPECAVDGECGALEMCQAGQCVPSGACNDDRDCPTSEVCAGTSLCVTRPTPYDPTEGAFECAGSCDCRLGETCNGTHCVAEALPQRFVSAGATGNGLSAATPSGDLAAALAAASPGDAVALRAGSNFTVPPAGLNIPSGVHLQGGYVECSPGRWVREPANTTTTIRQPAAAGTRALNVIGTPTAHSVDTRIRSLTVDTSAVTGAHVMIDAIYTDGLVIADVLLRPAFTLPAQVTVRGLACQGCGTLLVDRLTVQGGTVNVINRLMFTGVDLDRSNGTIRDLAIGPFLEVYTFTGVRVTQPLGNVTIDGAAIAAVAYGLSADGILITDVPSGSVTVQDSTIQWPVHASNGGNSFAGVRIVRTNAFDVHDVTVGDSGDLDVGPADYVEFAGFVADDSNGSFTNDHVELALSESVSRTIGYAITGPKGGVTLTDCDTTGFGAGETRLISVGAVDTGVPRVVRGNFRSDSNVSGSSQYGLYLHTTRVEVADARIQIAGRGTYAYGAYSYNSSPTIDRSSIVVRGDRAQVQTAYGIYQQAGTLDVHDSFVYAGDCVNNSTAYYTIAGNSYLGGNTFSTGRSANGITLYCNNTNVTARNNLVHADGLAGDFFYNNNVNCVMPGNWDHNAFYKSCPTGSYENVDDVVTTPAGTADAEGDRILTSSCLDPQYPQPDPRILAGSVCVGNGGTPLRRDGTTRTLDLYRGPRIEGTMLDIGAHESP
jgi:hypothetical protein